MILVSEKMILILKKIIAHRLHPLLPPMMTCLQIKGQEQEKLFSKKLTLKFKEKDRKEQSEFLLYFLLN
jgi:hypothetical protein